MAESIGRCRGTGNRASATADTCTSPFSDRVATVPISGSAGFEEEESTLWLTIPATAIGARHDSGGAAT